MPCISRREECIGGTSATATTSTTDSVDVVFRVVRVVKIHNIANVVNVCNDKFETYSNTRKNDNEHQHHRHTKKRMNIIIIWNCWCTIEILQPLIAGRGSKPVKSQKNWNLFFHWYQKLIKTWILEWGRYVFFSTVSLILLPISIIEINKKIRFYSFITDCKPQIGTHKSRNDKLTQLSDCCKIFSIVFEEFKLKTLIGEYSKNKMKKIENQNVIWNVVLYQQLPTEFLVKMPHLPQQWNRIITR